MFIYVGKFGFVHVKGIPAEPRWGALYTCRATWMKVPDDHYLIGRVENDNIELFAGGYYGMNERVAEPLKKLARVVSKAQSYEENCAYADVLFDKEYVHRKYNVDIIAFDESAAIKAVYDAGLRSGGDYFNWNRLVDYQEKHGEKSAC